MIEHSLAAALVVERSLAAAHQLAHLPPASCYQRGAIGAVPVFIGWCLLAWARVALRWGEIEREPWTSGSTRASARAAQHA